MTKKIMNRSACFTDIHWGRKNNSELHNQDCMRFIDWFCDEVNDSIKNDGEDAIDNIIFMGDWHEQRSAINGMTLDYSYKGALKLQSLNLPVYFIVGNHDLYYRTSRNIASTIFFDSMINFHFINKPTIIDELGPKKSLICPFLFESEYPSLIDYFNVPTWFGHFEFKGFVVTGDTKKLDHGPDPEDFNKPKRIFSGHFHKRQTQKNVTYIGNAFPADFSDANDLDRGMMIYTHNQDEVEFRNWSECPSYIRTTLSEMSKKPKEILRKDATVECLVDMDIDYETSIKVRNNTMKKYGLRELKLYEQFDEEAFSNTEVDEEFNEMDTTNQMVVKMLKSIEDERMDNEMLIKIYEGLNV